MSKLDLLLLARLLRIVATTLWAGAAILIAGSLMPAKKRHVERYRRQQFFTE